MYVPSAPKVLQHSLYYNLSLYRSYKRYDGDLVATGWKAVFPTQNIRDCECCHNKLIISLTAIIWWPWVRMSPNGSRGQKIYTNALLNYWTRCDSVEYYRTGWIRTHFYLLTVTTLFLKKILDQLRGYRPSMHPVAWFSEIVCPKLPIIEDNAWRVCHWIWKKLSDVWVRCTPSHDAGKSISATQKTKYRK